MRKMKKFLCAALASTMVLAMAAPSFAEPTEPTEESTAPFSNVPNTPIQTPAPAQKNLTLTINDTVKGHTYVAYQIFTGDLALDDKDNKVLSNIVWGKGVTPEGQAEFGVASVKAGTLTTADVAATFAKDLQNYLVGSGTSIDWNDTTKNYVLTGLDAGYYLVKQTGVANASEGYSAYILEMVGNTTTQPKQNSTPGFKKEIDGTNPPASYTVGDTISFVLTATIPDDIEDYITYPLIFKDTFDANNALTYAGGAVVKVGDTTIAVEDTDTTNDREGVSFSNGSDVTEYGNATKPSTLVVNISNVKALDGITIQPGTVITVSYDATVNSSADTGTTNPITNEANLAFRNNSNVDAATGSKDTHVDVYTFGFELTKQDGTDNSVKLPNAEFKITRVKGETTEVATIDANGKITGWVEAEFDANASDIPTTGDVFRSGTDGKVTIKGLGVGTYGVVEVKAPVGYNRIVGSQALVISDLTSTDDAFNNVEYTFAGGSSVYAAADQALLAATVNNNRGTVLPSTGGIGTTIFYAAGIILMAGAVFFVVRKRRA